MFGKFPLQEPVDNWDLLGAIVCFLNGTRDGKVGPFLEQFIMQAPDDMLAEFERRIGLPPDNDSTTEVR